MQIPSSLKANILNYFLVEIILEQRKAVARMLVACFETKS
jgi:hypothetical protein